MCGQCLGGVQNGVGIQVEEHGVGRGAAGVNTDPNTHGYHLFRQNSMDKSSIPGECPSV